MTLTLVERFQQILDATPQERQVEALATFMQSRDVASESPAQSRHKQIETAVTRKV